jgi:hypothetical protein
MICAALTLAAVRVAAGLAFRCRLTNGDDGAARQHQGSPANDSVEVCSLRAQAADIQLSSRLAATSPRQQPQTETWSKMPPFFFFLRRVSSNPGRLKLTKSHLQRLPRRFQSRRDNSLLQQLEIFVRRLKPTSLKQIAYLKARPHDPLWAFRRLYANGFRARLAQGPSACLLNEALGGHRVPTRTRQPFPHFSSREIRTRLRSIYQFS